jgi:hypothetical protein
MSIFKILIVTFSLFLLGCGDGSPTSSSVALVEGSYTITSPTRYDNLECSGTGSTGVCTTDQTATTEATCPSGMCMDGSGSAEGNCSENMWMSGMCLDMSGNAEADCAEGMWMNLGWNSYLDFMPSDFVVIFENGIYTASDAEEDVTGTYTVDGNTVTIISEDETNSGTINADGTITASSPISAGCSDGMGEEVEALNEEACNAVSGSWEEDSCNTMILTLVSN